MAAAILAVFCVLQLSPTWLSVISPVRLALYDEYQKVSPRLRETGPATVVAIDEDSLKERLDLVYPIKKKQIGLLDGGEEVVP